MRCYARASGYALRCWVYASLRIPQPARQRTDRSMPVPAEPRWRAQGVDQFPVAFFDLKHLIPALFNPHPESENEPDTGPAENHDQFVAGKEGEFHFGTTPRRRSDFNLFLQVECPQTICVLQERWMLVRGQ